MSEVRSFAFSYRFTTPYLLIFLGVIMLLGQALKVPGSVHTTSATTIPLNRVSERRQLFSFIFGFESSRKRFSVTPNIICSSSCPEITPANQVIPPIGPSVVRIDMHRWITGSSINCVKKDHEARVETDG